MLERYFQTDQNRNSEIVSTEKEYNLSLEGGISFHWTLDRLDKYPDGTHEIVEYKTNHHHWTDNRKESDLQMTLYNLGMKKTLGASSLKLKYYFLSSNEQVETSRTAEQLRSAEKLLQDIAGKIRQGKFDPNPDHCPKCEFANRCTNFQKPVLSKGQS
jgi:RecB family exonuclease